MVMNIVIDLVGGAIPVAGDVFDFLYEENMMNMRLLEKHRDGAGLRRSGAEGRSRSSSASSCCFSSCWPWARSPA
jgi:hypothetical protein